MPATGIKKISVHSCSFVVTLVLAGARIAPHIMNETHREDPHAPLSYYGARRIVWLVFFVFIIWLILRGLQPVILLFALVFLLAMVLNPIVVWLQKHRVPRFVGVILVMLALIAVTTTIILFAIPPLSRQLQQLVHSTPNMWQGIRARIESLTKNYPEVREALPRTDEMASKVGAAAATVGNFLLQSTLGLVGGLASALLAILLLVFVTGKPAPAHRCLPGACARSLSRAGAPHPRTDDATNDCVGAGRRDQRGYHRRVDRFSALVGWRAAGAHLRRIRISR